MDKLIEISTSNEEIKTIKIFNDEVIIGYNYPVMVANRGTFIEKMFISSAINKDYENYSMGVHNTQIGQFCLVEDSVYIILNNDANNNITSTVSKLVPQGNRNNVKRRGQVLIQNDVKIERNSIIYSGVTIHNGAIIKAGSIVNNDVPSYAIVSGNPAKVIGYRFKKEVIDKLLQIKWWDWNNEKIVKSNRYFNSDIETFISKFYIGKENNLVNKEQSLIKVYLVILDFEDKFCLWDNIIKQFVSKFKNDDKVLLKLYLDNNSAQNNKQIACDFNVYIDQMLIPYDAKCNIKVQIGKSDEGIENIFKSADYYIADRSMNTIKYSCIADCYNVKILSGVDYPIFDQYIQHNNVKKIYRKYLAIGNSITKHPLCDYWYGKWGMAASKKENDYVHIVSNELLQKNKSFEFLPVNFASWEISNDRKSELKNLDEYLKDDIDIITIFLGENVNDISTFYDDFENLVMYIKDRCQNVRIIIMGMFWKDDKKDFIKRSIAEKFNLEFIELADKYDNNYYKLKVNSVVSGDDKKDHIIDNLGVARHPNDLGMCAIASEILKIL